MLAGWVGGWKLFLQIAYSNKKKHKVNKYIVEQQLSTTAPGTTNAPGTTTAPGTTIAPRAVLKCSLINLKLSQFHAKNDI